MVSVIIPAYSSGHLVEQAIDSALAQTAPPMEVIVIDDGSTDDTAERVARYGAAVRYVRQENQGVAAARNHGLRLAAGEFIAFLDADDVWDATKLERQLECLAKHPEIGLLGTGVYPLHGRPARAEAAGTGETPVPRVELSRLLVRNYFTTSSVIVRRDVLERAGDFDTQLQGPEDYDMWLRLAELTQAAVLDAPLTGYRTVPGSLSRRAEAMEAGMRRILEKLDARGVWESAACAAGWRMLRLKAYSYAHYSWAYMYSAAGMPGRAMLNLSRSLVLYPLPYAREEVSMPLARARMAGGLARRLMRGGGVRRVNHGLKARVTKEAADHVPGAGLSLEVRLRRGQGWFWGGAKRVGRAVLSWHIPVGRLTRPVFGGLYRLHVLGREAGIWGLRFFWYEPLFRSQCAAVGERFRMEKLPYLVGRGRIVIGCGVRLSGKPSMSFCNRVNDVPELVIGDETFIGHGCSIAVADSVRIGRGCLIAGGVSIRDWDGHPVDARARAAGEAVRAEGVRGVVVEDGVWIGSGARILKGVRIGRGAVVGAGAVVTGEVPPGVVVAGNPARVVKRAGGSEAGAVSVAA